MRGQMQREAEADESVSRASHGELAAIRQKCNENCAGERNQQNEREDGLIEFAHLSAPFRG